MQCTLLNLTKINRRRGKEIENKEILGIKAFLKTTYQLLILYNLKENRLFKLHISQKDDFLVLIFSKLRGKKLKFFQIMPYKYSLTH